MPFASDTRTSIPAAAAETSAHSIPLQAPNGATAEDFDAQPAELASIYAQLAASDASFTTGNIYGAGGGQGQP
ncbi:MAG: hypothetical protein U1F35_18450 [Steroidobacteraceae bacterium]